MSHFEKKKYFVGYSPVNNDLHKIYLKMIIYNHKNDCHCKNAM